VSATISFVEPLIAKVLKKGAAADPNTE